MALHSQTSDDIFDYIMKVAEENLDSKIYEILSFIVDKHDIKSKFKIDTWQKMWGFNDLYDWGFMLGVNDNAAREKFLFTDRKNKEYILWLWRGDYLNVGAGAEMGLYTKNKLISNTLGEHWDAVDFTLPMTLSNYNYYNEDDIENIFCWDPVYEQWWITGFNPELMDNDVKKQVLMGSIDFSGHEDMFESLKQNIGGVDDFNKFIIFDKEETRVWITWYDVENLVWEK